MVYVGVGAGHDVGNSRSSTRYVREGDGVVFGEALDVLDENVVASGPKVYAVPVLHPEGVVGIRPPVRVARPAVGRNPGQVGLEADVLDFAFRADAAADAPVPLVGYLYAADGKAPHVVEVDRAVVHKRLREGCHVGADILLEGAAGPCAFHSGTH